MSNSHFRPNGEMLRDVGLLSEEESIKGHCPFPAGPEYQGLVIDDIFMMSVAPPGLAPVRKVKIAVDQYDREKVLGSPEKDIIGSSHFEVVGAEVDASRRTRSLGLVTVAAPLQNRFAMMSSPCVLPGRSHRRSQEHYGLAVTRRVIHLFAR